MGFGGPKNTFIRYPPWNQELTAEKLPSQKEMCLPSILKGEQLVLGVYQIE